MAKTLRWGILGTAGIAKKNWLAIHHTGNSTVAAVASRDPARSSRFIAECQQEAPMPAVPTAFGAYEALLASPDVDVVYIPVPTGVRKEWVLRAAAAGKHVVCEKPCSVTVADLREMIDACRGNQVQFMDGVMFMHSRRLPRLREALNAGQSVGAIKRITSAFSYRAAPEFFSSNIRGDSRLEPHGCVGDLGWYCIRLALWTMDWQMPIGISARVLSQSDARSGSDPVITEFSSELVFPRGVSASFYCSFVSENQQWANITGTRGYIQMDDFVLPIVGNQVAFQVHKYEFNVKGCDFRMEPNVQRITVPEHSHGHPTAQETNLFRNFAEQVLSGKLNEQWPDEALKTQTVMCECIKGAERR